MTPASVVDAPTQAFEERVTYLLQERTRLRKLAPPKETEAEEVQASLVQLIVDADDDDLRQIQELVPLIFCGVSDEEIKNDEYLRAATSRLGFQALTPAQVERAMGCHADTDERFTGLGWNMRKVRRAA